MRRANLENADLENANLTGANLTGATFSGDNTNLSSAYLTDANLEDVNLSGANLSFVNLTGANLDGASLITSGLKYANLDSASLIGANLENVDLEDTNLSSVNLTGANLTGASLIGADVSGADFKDAFGITYLTGAINVQNAKNIPRILIEYESEPEYSEYEIPDEILGEYFPSQQENAFEETPREDQIISYFTITGKLKSTKDRLFINLNEKVESYDPIEMETINVTIKDYIKKDKDNIVIAYENREGKNEYFFTKRSTITKSYLDLDEISDDEEQKEIIEEAEYNPFYRKENFVFPCKKAENKLKPEEENVIKYAYFDLAKLGFINAPQKYCDMQKYDLNRNNQLFAVVPLVDANGDQADYPSFVGLEVYNNPMANVVSALHCQAGQENKVCRLIVGTPTCGDAENIVKGPSERGRKKKTKKKKRKGNLIKKIVIQK